MARQSRTKEEKTKHLKFLEILVRQRNSTQDLLLALLTLSFDSAEAFKAAPDLNSMFQLTVGATFSLWRAIVLAEEPFEPHAALDHAEDLLRRLVGFNTIVFSDEKETKQWMGGFYVANIQYRLWHLDNAFGASHLQIDELKNFAILRSPLVSTPEESTLPTIEDDLPLNATRLFDEAITCISLVIKRIENLASSDPTYLK
jgi:hypothetical protein